MSKLDRFLVSNGLLSVFPHILAVCLDRHLSDHRPILLREVMIDYGATPFRFFSSWFDFQGFDLMVTQTWNSITLNDNNGMIRFKKNFKSLKRRFVREAIDDLLASRMELLNQLHDFKTAETTVKGVMIDGEWVDEPNRVKEEFRDYFAARFNEPGIRHGHINYTFPNRLNEEHVAHLETPITRDEIRLAVWGCGENKSPGPDGFTFEFFRMFLVVVGPDFCTVVEWFFDHESFPIGCNSSLIDLIPKSLEPKTVGDYRPISLIGCLYKVVTKIIATRLSSVISDLVSDVQTAFLPNRQILDGPFIINELLACCRYKKQRAMIFKVDFAKAYDSIRWDYLEAVLNSFGFDHKWRSWIQGSLYSSMASILVNGSPTSEFQFHRGLKQGDPLAPYLFILIMESLHLSLSRVIEAGVFTGGRLTLLIYVLGSTPIYNMSLYKVPKTVLSSMESIRRNFFNGIREGERKIAWVKWTKDLWIGDSRLCLAFSRLYALENNKDCTVAVKMNGTFVSSFRGDVRGGLESTQLSQLLDLLDSVVLSNSDDRWVWDLNGEGLEDLDHLLFCCSMAIDVTRSIF
nr:RNA-directed DNA polymerase, eukaryota [Tanacetum cinerariifolium]